MKEALKLTEAEEQHLHIIVHRGKANARSMTRARVVLKLSEGWSDDQITALNGHCGHELPFLGISSMSF